MMTKKILSIIVCLCIFQHAFSQEIWTLKRSVEYALANNISVRQADIQSRLTALTLKQSRQMQYPSASVSGSAGVNAGRSIDPTTNLFTNTQLLSTGFSLSSAMTVFNFFSIKNNIEGSRYDLEASRVNIEKIKNDIAMNVATAYLLALVAQEQENIARVSVEQTLQNLENTRKRVDAGALPELNLAELEAQLARDSSTLIASNNSVRQNLLQLKALLNIDAGDPFVIASPPLEQIPVQSFSELRPEAVYNLALTNLPQQKMNDLRILAAKKFVQAARGQMYPAFSLFAGMGSNYANNKTPVVTRQPTGTLDTTGAKVQINGAFYDVVTPGFTNVITTHGVPFTTQMSDNFRQNIGVQVNIPLFNNGSARTAWERSKLNVNSYELQKDQDLLTLKQDIYKAYNDAVSSFQQFNAGKKSVQTAEKAYQFAQKRYELGLLSTIDLLTNQNNLTRARMELSQSQVDYVFKLKLLEFYKGQGMTLE